MSCCFGLTSEQVNLREQHLREQLEEKDRQLSRKVRQLEYLQAEHDRELDQKDGIIADLQRRLQQCGVPVSHAMSSRSIQSYPQNARTVGSDTYRHSRRPSLEPRADDDTKFHDAIDDTIGHTNDSIPSRPMSMHEVELEMTVKSEVAVDKKVGISAKTVGCMMFTDDASLPDVNDPNKQGQPLDHEELEILRQIKENFPEVFDQGSYELVTRAIRGYSAAGDPIDVIIEAVKNICAWRMKEGMDTITSRKLPHHDKFSNAWYGHCLLLVNVAQQTHLCAI
jgi:hypothetical protein